MIFEEMMADNCYNGNNYDCIYQFLSQIMLGLLLKLYYETSTSIYRQNRPKSLVGSSASQVIHYTEAMGMVTMVELCRNQEARAIHERH